MKKTTPAYGEWNSFRLSPEQVKQVLQVFEFDLLEDSGTDEKAAALLLLVRAFTYTTDSAEREYMLNAAEAAIAPYVGAVDKLLKQLAINAHQSLLRVNTSQ